MRKPKVACFRYRRHNDIYVSNVSISSDVLLPILDAFPDKKIIVLIDSVYLRSSQNSQPNSDASDVNSRKERGRVFRIARSDPPPAF